jgi:hypothetical protein
MIELLHPDIRPINKVGKSFFDEFIKLSYDSDYMLMTSGYVSEDAVFFLKQNLNNLPPFDLGVGMHGIEGFTKSQYDGLVDLNAEMINEHKGMSYVSDALKFHGKAYSFFKDDKPFAALIGSTNISILGDRDKRQFEIDLLVDDPRTLKNVVSIQRDLISYSKEVDKFVPARFITPNAEPYISQIQKVSKLPILKVSAIDTERVKNNTLAGHKFELTLSCEDRSSLNVPFGKGRGGGESGRGKITKRSWLEGEAIIPISITSLPNYPLKNDEFWVVTDDGWSFKCWTSGGNAKNFRSKGDLHIFGAWIKGRLTSAGVVEYGQKITKDMLAAYGRSTMTLAKTSLTQDDLPIYFLDYSIH